MLFRSHNLFPSHDIELQKNALDMSVTYGYSPRYSELKSSRDYYEGGFCGTYSTWVTGYD